MEEGSQKQDLHRYHRLNPESSGHYPNLILVGIIVLLLNVAVFLEHKGQQTFTGRQSHQEKAARRKHTAFSNRPPTSAHSAHGLARYSHKGRYVLVSWLLYESPDTVPITLPFFLKSAGGCGADVVLLSTTDIPFAIPSNVRVHRTTKKELINRMEQNVFGGIKLDGLRGQDGNGPEGYKSIDFKVSMLLYQSHSLATSLNEIRTSKFMCCTPTPTPTPTPTYWWDIALLVSLFLNAGLPNLEWEWC